MIVKAAPTPIVNPLDPDRPDASVTVTVKLDDPAVVACPLMTPFVPIVSPDGKLPCVIVQTNGVDALGVAVSATEYSAPGIVFGREKVVIAGGTRNIRL